MAVDASVSARASPKSATLTWPPWPTKTFSGFVPMHDPGAVGDVQRRQNRIDHLQRVPRRQSTLLAQQLPEGPPLDVLHREVDRAVVLALVEHGHDGRVGEPGGGRASAVNRTTKSVSAARSGCMTLSATTRSSRASTARYTVAMPPRATIASTPVAAVDNATDQRCGDA